MEGFHQDCGRRTIRPIAHIVAEKGVSHTTTSKWVKSYRQHSETGLGDLTSHPMLCPLQTPD